MRGSICIALGLMAVVLVPQPLQAARRVAKPAAGTETPPPPPPPPPPLPTAAPAETPASLPVAAVAAPTVSAKAPASALGAAQESIAILAFAAHGVDQHIADIVTQSATAAIDRLGVFRVISADDIRSMLTAEALKQAVGCSESTCLAEIAGAIGATYIIAGSVGKLGSAYQLSLTLIDQARAQTVDRVVRQDEVAVSQLPALADAAARQVVRKLLAAKQGALDLVVNEAGADLVVDDALVGVAPLIAPLKLPQGPHRLAVAKAGFITHKQDVEVRPNETTGVTVRLTPNAEFREAYRSRNRTLRTLAWLTTGSALVGGAVALGAYVYNRQKLDDADKLLNNADVFGSDPNHPRILIPDDPDVDAYRELQGHALVSTAVAYSALGVAA
ncbi:MAG: PEGA domain-containing protein, partial [Deltaproteobacteria bacterium]|nr:PEGA domain-containing protein [Deltaproteobacteria bacterium]